MIILFYLHSILTHYTSGLQIIITFEIKILIYTHLSSTVKDKKELLSNLILINL